MLLKLYIWFGEFFIRLLSYMFKSSIASTDVLDYWKPGKQLLLVIKELTGSVKNKIPLLLK